MKECKLFFFSSPPVVFLAQTRSRFHRACSKMGQTAWLRQIVVLLTPPQKLPPPPSQETRASLRPCVYATLRNRALPITTLCIYRIQR